MTHTDTIAQQSRHRLLVVEDDAEIRESLGSLLTEEGYEVQTALNGLEALIKLNNSALPEVILLDLTMPVLDGQQFLAVLRDRPQLRKIPVVVVSAVAFRPAPGASAVISKPIDYGKLLTVIRSFCESPQG